MCEHWPEYIITSCSKLELLTVNLQGKHTRFRSFYTIEIRLLYSIEIRIDWKFCVLRVSENPLQLFTLIIKNIYLFFFFLELFGVDLQCSNMQC